MGFAGDLHVWLAGGSALALGAVAMEGAYRALKKAPPGPFAARAADACLMLLGLTAAGGLAILSTGGRPFEDIHLLYALLAFAAVPVADRYALDTSAGNRAVTRAAAALVGLALLLRLWQTG